MSKSSFKRFLLAFTLMGTVLAGCKNKQPFTPKGWDDGDGIEFPKRYMMVDDLLASKKLIGLSYQKTVWLLKAPQHNSRISKSFSYEITRKMSGIDTLYTKDLVLTLGPDSIVTDAKVVEKTFEKKKKK
jgi:hypothetical protein